MNELFAWLIAVGVTWLSVRSILSVVADRHSSDMKAVWIAFIIWTPLLGPVAYWLFGSTRTSNDTPRV